MAKDPLKPLISHAKEYGFVFPSSEIYGSPGALYDYGPYGVELKNNIKTYWWKAMVQVHENIVGLDSSILMHPRVWEASGHVDAFFDFFVDNKVTGKRYRFDHLVEEHIAKLEKKGKKEEAESLRQQLEKALSEQDTEYMYEVLVTNDIRDPESPDKTEWTPVRHLRLMFETKLGAAEDAITAYLRPETAQGIFVNFLNVQKTARQKIPFGIAQIGKAFRNELIARQFVMRMREFEQMEMQFFIRPGEDEHWFEVWKEKRLKWYKAIGIPEEKLRIKPHDHLAHYAKAAVDIEYKFPMGFKEIEGIHARTNFDLSRHQEFSGKKLQYFDPDLQESYVPHVVETSAGLDRVFLAIFSEALTTEQLDGGKQRTVLKLHPILAPIKVAVFPLVKKDGLPEKAREIFNQLRFKYMCFYEEKDSIGRRYRRHDAIGTPFCITIDYQTLEDNSVTLRDRDTMQQERIHIHELEQRLDELLDWKTLLQKVV